MIWLKAPSSSHGQNDCGGHGSLSPELSSTKARNSSENGKPNRKRMLVAPQVPSFAVNDRCMALRATWPAEAISVKGIQSVAIENMKGFAGGPCCQPCPAHPARSTEAMDRSRGWVPGRASLARDDSVVSYAAERPKSKLPYSAASTFST